MIVKENLPGFASRYFSYNMDLKTPRTLYGYALDLKLFFEYLEQVSCKVDKMTIKDLETITPDIIENYLEFSYIVTLVHQLLTPLVSMTFYPFKRNIFANPLYNIYYFTS